MGVESVVVCHTSIKKYSEQFGVEIEFKEGDTYVALAYSEKHIDIYDEKDDYFIAVNDDEFFRNFTTISCIKNEDEFCKIITPKAVLNEILNNNIRQLNLLTQWQNKKLNKQKQ